MLAEEVVSAIKKGLPATALIKKLFELLDEAELMVRAEYTPLDAEGRTIAPFLTAMGFRQEKLIFPIYCFQTAKKIRFDSRALPGSMAQVLSFAEAPEKLLADMDELSEALNLAKHFRPTDKDKEELRGILAKMKANEELTKEEKRFLGSKTQYFMTYDYHQMAGHYNEGGLMLTTEAFAADATQYVVETFTMHGAVGLYRNTPGKTKGSVGYYNAMGGVPQSAMKRLKIWFKIANQGKLSEAS